MGGKGGKEGKKKDSDSARSKLQVRSYGGPQRNENLEERKKTKRRNPPR